MCFFLVKNTIYIVPRSTVLTSVLARNYQLTGDKGVPQTFNGSCGGYMHQNFTGVSKINGLIGECHVMQVVLKDRI